MILPYPACYAVPRFDDMLIQLSDVFRFVVSNQLSVIQVKIHSDKKRDLPVGYIFIFLSDFYIFFSRFGKSRDFTMTI